MHIEGCRQWLEGVPGVVQADLADVGRRRPAAKARLTFRGSIGVRNQVMNTKLVWSSTNLRLIRCSWCSTVISLQEPASLPE